MKRKKKVILKEKETMEKVNCHSFFILKTVFEDESIIFISDLIKLLF